MVSTGMEYQAQLCVECPKQPRSGKNLISLWPRSGAKSSDPDNPINNKKDGSLLALLSQRKHTLSTPTQLCAPPEAIVTALADSTVHGKDTKRLAVCDWMDEKDSRRCLKDEIVTCCSLVRHVLRICISVYSVILSI
ncbi:hypothetical protein F2P81_019233 [Scophthalmus maximus]|uniref:Uncharacterized protein n=1 Tax=Scophthalmus maximus TaxID=52904 RepID=A0A6A4RZ33_SCOMX|nr:hypothetical protein F2P81_019233 [Scophthalmus maximus]